MILFLCWPAEAQAVGVTHRKRRHHSMDAKIQPFPPLAEINEKVRPISLNNIYLESMDLKEYCSP